MKNRPRHYFSIFLVLAAWTLLLGGIYILWTEEGGMSSFMNYLFTSFGLAGMVWMTLIVFNKL